VLCDELDVIGCEMCVMSGGVSGGRGGRTRKERRVQSEKQEPHTVMWGTMKNWEKERDSASLWERWNPGSEPSMVQDGASVLRFSRWKKSGLNLRRDKGVNQLHFHKEGSIACR